MPDETVKMSIRMSKLSVVRSEELVPTECIVAPTGLFWQDEITEEFDVAEDLTEYVEE